MNPCHFSDGPIRVLVNHYAEVSGGPYTLTVSFEGNAAATPTLMSLEELLPRLRAGKRVAPTGGAR